MSDNPPRPQDEPSQLTEEQADPRRPGESDEDYRRRRQEQEKPPAE
jgi:hypothetical protein